MLLVCAYDLGRPPFDLASAAAWLEGEGVPVSCLDLSVERFRPAVVQEAETVVFFLPMHTAARLTLRRLPEFRAANPDARWVFCGLYAAVLGGILRERAPGCVVLGVEAEAALRRLILDGDAGGPVDPNHRQRNIPRLRFRVPSRVGLPPPAAYAHLIRDGARVPAGSTQASRGCRHRCRHCPVVPAYDGVFRVVDADVVLKDVESQVSAGARHITFGDPDFLNGPGHVVPLVREFHRRFPAITYDITAKVSHLKRHRRLLPLLRDTGCILVTTAVESFDDAVLERLDKGHSFSDFLEVLECCRRVDLALQPTFVAFHPWMDLDGYGRFLETLAALGLVDAVRPIQLTLRLLIPPGSRLLELPDVRALAGPLDADGLVHPWRHPNPEVDSLQRDLQQRVAVLEGEGHSTRAIHREVVRRAREAGVPVASIPGVEDAAPPRATVPYLTEPWYC